VGIAGWLPGRTTAVVLHGDVVGFSRLVGTDPVYALNLLRQSQGLIAGIVVRHNGRIVNAVGDCFLAEFHRAVDAVACACEMQQDLKRLNQPRPEESRMRFRLGINSGIVLQNGDDLFGDCVNVAARVQVLAAPDGICIAESVYREIEGELPYKFKSLGLQSLKNITEPVEVFQITE
jgi:class 3 adenylate cyclase